MRAGQGDARSAQCCHPGLDPGPRFDLSACRENWVPGQARGDNEVSAQIRRSRLRHQQRHSIGERHHLLVAAGKVAHGNSAFFRLAAADDEVLERHVLDLMTATLQPWREALTAAGDDREPEGVRST